MGPAGCSGGGGAVAAAAPAAVIAVAVAAPVGSAAVAVAAAAPVGSAAAATALDAAAQACHPPTYQSKSLDQQHTMETGAARWLAAAASLAGFVLVLASRAGGEAEAEGIEAETGVGGGLEQEVQLRHWQDGLSAVRSSARQV